MPAVAILDSVNGQVLIHHYTEDRIESMYNGDIEDYLLGEDIIPNVENYDYLCMNELIINTI